MKIAKAFSVYRDLIVKNFEIGKLDNTVVLEIYDYLFKRCLKDSRLGYLGLGYLETKNSKKEKILFVKTILSTLFQSSTETGYITVLESKKVSSRW